MIGRGRLGVAVTVVCAAAGVAGAAGVADGSAAPATPPGPCPGAVHGLGRIALVARGGLQLIDLRSCRVRRVAGGRAWSPQFSPDGRWLAYSRSAPDHSGSAVVLPAGGGTARTPLGTGIRLWWWAPRGAALYGINSTGQLVRAAPGGRPRIVAHGAKTFRAAVAPSPDGRRVATNTSACMPAGFELGTAALATGAHRVALSRRQGLATFAGWSPDGHWLLYWAQAMCSASLSADGWPLAAAPASGGRVPARAVAHMLLYPDFLSWCGGRLIAAATPSRETQLGSALVATGPPAWRRRTIAPAARLSWVSPACAPSGSMLAAAAGPSSTTARFGLQHRSIWLLTPGGRILRQLTAPPASDLSDEAPRFSGDGRWILYVRTRVITVGAGAVSWDTLELVPATATGPVTAVPVARFTSDDFGFYDHFRWSSEIAWSGAAR